MIRFISSIFIGLGLGYLAQRSRMCFVGGIRDYLLVKDKVLLRGFVSFFITAWIVYSILFFSGVLKPNLYNGTIAKNNVSNTSIENNNIQADAINNREYQEASSNSNNKNIFTVAPKLNLLSIVFLISGFAVGILSVFANGCPLRQHVLAAQGNLDSVSYLFGFYIAIVIYDIFTVKIILFIFKFI